MDQESPRQRGGPTEHRFIEASELMLSSAAVVSRMKALTDAKLHRERLESAGGALLG